MTVAGGNSLPVLQDPRIDPQLVPGLLDAVGHTLIATAVGGHILYWNRAAEEMYGRAADEVLGASILDGTVIEGDLPKSHEIMAELAEGRAWTGEMLVRRRNGEPFPAVVTDTVVRDAGGDLVAIVGASFDITDQRRHAAELARSEALYRRAFDEGIQAISTICDLRDPYTAGHQRSVARLCRAAAQRLGLDRDATHGLAVAATLHDIGKITVPAEILSKSGTLTGPERALIEEHPQRGHDIMSRITLPWPVATMILQHHEHLDAMISFACARVTPRQ